MRVRRPTTLIPSYNASNSPSLSMTIAWPCSCWGMLLVIFSVLRSTKMVMHGWPSNSPMAVAITPGIANHSSVWSSRICSIDFEGTGATCGLVATSSPEQPENNKKQTAMPSATNK